MSERTEPSASATPLVDVHDALLVDLDGVVQLDDEPVDAAADSLGAARARGLRIVFLTNNAARTPAEVVARLARLGVEATAGEVISSAMAAARLLGERYEPGTPVLVVGGDGLVTAIADAGLRPVHQACERPTAVVQGWAPEVGWTALAEAAVALNAGAEWIATNLDRTLPSPRGPLPGNGSLVAALCTATGREPESVGKPCRPLFDAAVAQAGARAALVIGDRLDTDIAGAANAGLPSLLVLTGVARPVDLLGAPPGHRPTYVGRDLRALFEPHPPVRVDADGARCGATTVTVAGDVRTNAGAGAQAPDGLDGLRAACALAWRGRLAPDAYAACTARLGLD